MNILPRDSVTHSIVSVKLNEDAWPTLPRSLSFNLPKTSPLHLFYGDVRQLNRDARMPYREPFTILPRQSILHFFYYFTETLRFIYREPSLCLPRNFSLFNESLRFIYLETSYILPRNFSLFNERLGFIYRETSHTLPRDLTSFT